MVFQVQFISRSLNKIFFRNEDKLAALLVYSSYRRVATNLLRSTSLLTSSSSQVSQVERKLGVNTDSLRIQNSFIAHNLVIGMMVASPD